MRAAAFTLLIGCLSHASYPSLEGSLALLHCGDGILDGDEQCDEGGSNSDFCEGEGSCNGCTTACLRVDLPQRINIGEVYVVDMAITETNLFWATPGAISTLPLAMLYSTAPSHRFPQTVPVTGIEVTDDAVFYFADNTVQKWSLSNYDAASPVYSGETHDIAVDGADTYVASKYDLMLVGASGPTSAGVPDQPRRLVQDATQLYATSLMAHSLMAIDKSTHEAKTIVSGVLPDVLAIDGPSIYFNTSGGFSIAQVSGGPVSVLSSGKATDVAVSMGDAFIVQNEKLLKLHGNSEPTNLLASFPSLSAERVRVTRDYIYFTQLAGNFSHLYRLKR